MKAIAKYDDEELEILQACEISCNTGDSLCGYVVGENGAETGVHDR